MFKSLIAILLVTALWLPTSAAATETLTFDTLTNGQVVARHTALAIPYSIVGPVGAYFATMTVNGELLCTSEGESLDGDFSGGCYYMIPAQPNVSYTFTVTVTSPEPMTATITVHTVN